jgi:hypothetical protein
MASRNTLTQETSSAKSEDLDADDAEVPRTVSEYVVEICFSELPSIAIRTTSRHNVYVSGKLEEVVRRSAMNFLYYADSSYTEAEILQAEKYILKMLDWNMNYPNPIHFLFQVSKVYE